MKFACASLCLVACCAGVASAAGVDERELRLFKDFMTRNNKAYASDTEFNARLGYFRSAIQLADEHTSERYTVGLNWEGLDMSPAERRSLRGYTAPADLPFGSYPAAIERFHADPNMPVPANLDWRAHVPSPVSAIKQQGQGETCWTFSAVGSIEGAQALKHNQTAVSVSNQQILDCSGISCADAVNGTMTVAFEDIIKWGGGMDSDSTYPYRDGNCVYWDATCNPSMLDPGCAYWAPPHTCQHNDTQVAIVTGYKHTLVGNETDLMMALQFGPVSVAIDASPDSFASYQSGIYDDKACGNTMDALDHGVLAVGYGTLGPDQDYWIVKNSWGDGWGMKGFFYLARNHDDRCGIALDASFAIVE